MKRFWMSWYVEEDDHRPLTYPPNKAVLGWWCTGYDGNGRATLCGLIEAETEDAAQQAVFADWPGIEWRFVDEMEPGYVVTSDRFPLSDWMVERLQVSEAS